MVFGFVLLFLTHSKVFLEERFDPGWENRWIKPTKVRKGIQLGRVRLTAGDFFGDEKIQRGIETMDQRKYYFLTSNFSNTMDTRNRDLILQYTVRMNFHVDCAGQYIKLLDSRVDTSKFSNETNYEIMFGPDVCGSTFRRTHFIISHKGKQYPTLHPLNCFKDHLTHSYTLIIRANNSLEVHIDGEIVDDSTLQERFAIPPASEIPDPSDVKPPNWVDDEYIVDPNDKKPLDWVDEEFVPDPDAFKPPSWDDTIKWAPPMIRNPKYKGDWTPRVVKNPQYKGVWMPKMKKQEVPFDPTFGHFPSISYLGMEFFQNCPGSIFDNFLVTDDEVYARKMLEEVFLNIRDAEVKSFDERSERLRKEHEIENLRRDKDMDNHHDMDAFSDSDSETEQNYFDVRRGQAKKKKTTSKPSDQFDDL